MSLIMHNIDLTVDGVPYLHDINLEFGRGTLYTVLGRTQSGKTTLLRTIAGLQSPQKGDLTLDGRGCLNVPVWKRNIAMVYQQFINYPHLNILANVAFPLRRAGVPKEEAHRRARDVLKKVGLAEMELRRPSALSGGQQQRVALARALVKSADILLLDEPLVNLDYKLREQLREEFLNIFTGQDDAIVIYTTTDPAEAIQLGHELIILHEGAVIQKDKPLNIFHKPATIRCAEIINDPPMNILEGVILGNEIRLRGDVNLPAPEHIKGLSEGNYRFGIRAADLTLGGTLQSEVELSEISGSQTILHLKASIGSFIVHEADVHNYHLGSMVGVNINPEFLYAFAVDGELISAPQPPNQTRI